MATIIGTDNPERLLGTAFADRIEGQGADDVLKGRAGNDELLGGIGRDVLIGGDGADLLLGEDGADRLRGGLGLDSLEDGLGADRLEGGADADLFRIGLDADVDVIRDYETGLDSILLLGLAGAEVTLETVKPGKVVIRHGDDLLVVKDRAGLLTAEDIDLLPTAADDVAATDEGVPLLIDVLANDFGDALTLSALDLDGTSGLVEITETGEIRYDPGALNPAAGATLLDSFGYETVDADGRTTEARVTVTVSGVATEPTLAPLERTVSEDNPAVIFDLNSGVLDTGANPAVSFEISGLDFDLIGNTAVFDPPADLDSLAEGDSAMFTGTYTVTNSDGVSATEDISVTVEGQNDDPEASDISLSASGLSDTFIFSGQVVAEDIDDGAMLTFSGGPVQSDGAYSVLVFALPQETTTLSFTYTVMDEFGASDTGLLTLSYTNLNDDIIPI